MLNGLDSRSSAPQADCPHFLAALFARRTIQSVYQSECGPRFQLTSVRASTLVQSTHDRIKAALAADAWARVDALVQSEKRHMKIGVGGGQQ